MSATYRIVGERNLRKYTEDRQSPVYAAESEVKFISTHLCDVPWGSANGVRDARMTWHTSENVGTDDNPVSGLDQNVVIRDQFDAALFCAGHVGGSHRAYANAACYRYELPPGAIGKTLESLTASVTSDPYNAVGARIALLTNSTGEIPTDCGLCRNGGRLVNGSYTQDASYHTEGGVAKRRAAGTGSAETWYPTTEYVTLEPDGFVLQKYLMVFVLLENYDFNRGNWIEGSSFIENRIAVTLNQAVSGWSEGAVIDLSGTPAATTFPVSGEGGGAIRAGGSSVVMFESSMSGWKFPERKVVPLAPGSGHAFLKFPPSFGWSSFSAGLTPGMSSVNLNVNAYRVVMASGTIVRRRLYFSYNPGFDSMPGGFLPGLSLRYSKFSGTSEATQLLPLEQNALVTPATVHTDQSSGSSLPAMTMLSDGTAATVRIPVASGVHFSHDSKTFLAIPVVVSGPLGSYILGFLCCVARTDSAYAETSGDADLFYFLFANAELGSVNFAAGGAGSFDVDIGNILTTSFAITPDFDSYVAGTGADAVTFMSGRISSVHVDQITGGVRVSHSSAGWHVDCLGETVSIAPSGGVANGDSYVVRGRMTSVGGKPCSRYAFIRAPIGSDLAVTTDREIEASHLFSGGSVFGAALYQGPTGWDTSSSNLAVLTGTFTSVDDVEYDGACAVDLDSGLVREVDLPELPTGEYVTQISGVGGLVRNSVKTVWTATPQQLIEAFEPSAYDEHLLDDSDSAAVLGLRNCFGDLADGAVRDRSTFDVISGVSFIVRKGSRDIVISQDGGGTASPVSFPVWRILASSLVIPTSMPSTFRAGKVVLSWDSGISESGSARVNVWILPGQRVDLLDRETEVDHRLYDASERTVGGWILAGTCVPKAGSTDSFTIPDAVSAGPVATVLLTAYVPGDSLTPGQTYPVGVGSLSADSDGVISGVGGGLAPDVSFEP